MADVHPVDFPLRWDHPRELRMLRWQRVHRWRSRARRLWRRSMHRILPTLVLALAMAGVARAELPDPKIVLSPCNRPAVLEWEMRLLSGEQTRARFAPGFRGLCFHPRIQEPHRAWVAVRARCVPGTIEAPDRENATDWTAWTYRGDPDPALHVSSCPHLEVP